MNKVLIIVYSLLGSSLYGMDPLADFKRLDTARKSAHDTYKNVVLAELRSGCATTIFAKLYRGDDIVVEGVDIPSDQAYTLAARAVIELQSERAREMSLKRKPLIGASKGWECE